MTFTSEKNESLRHTRTGKKLLDIFPLACLGLGWFAPIIVPWYLRNQEHLKSDV